MVSREGASYRFRSDGYLEKAATLVKENTWSCKFELLLGSYLLLRFLLDGEGREELSHPRGYSGKRELGFELTVQNLEASIDVDSPRDQHL